MVRSVLGLLAALAFAACGGKLAPVPADGGAGPSSGEGTTNGTDPIACSSTPLAPTRACVPGRGRERSAIQIEIDRPGGCLPCGGAVQKCAVDVQGSQLTLSTTVQVCDASPATCACAAEKATCRLPPLPAGTYTLALADEPLARARRRGSSSSSRRARSPARSRARGFRRRRSTAPTTRRAAKRMQTAP